MRLSALWDFPQAGNFRLLAGRREKNAMGTGHKRTVCPPLFASEHIALTPSLAAVGTRPHRTRIIADRAPSGSPIQRA